MEEKRIPGAQLSMDGAQTEFLMDYSGKPGKGFFFFFLGGR